MSAHLREAPERDTTFGVVRNCLGFLPVQLSGSREECPTTLDANDCIARWEAWFEQEHPCLGWICESSGRLDDVSVTRTCGSACPVLYLIIAVGLPPWTSTHL